MVVKMEQKELNNLSAEELDAMADALLAADDAKQAETKAAPAADEPAEDKPVAEKPESEKTTEEKLNELVEKGKKAGKLSSKDLMVLEDMNLSSEETEKFYDQLESLNIDGSATMRCPRWTRTRCPSSRSSRRSRKSPRKR